MAGTNQKAARRLTATNALTAAATQLIELVALPIEQPVWQKDQEIADLQRLEYSATVMVAAVVKIKFQHAALKLQDAELKRQEAERAERNAALAKEGRADVNAPQPIHIPEPTSEIQYERAQPIPEPQGAEPTRVKPIVEGDRPDRRLPRKEGKQ